MRYELRRMLHSQNFLRNPKLVVKLVRNSSIGKDDTVIEIGPGRGIITSELINVAGKVIAVEIDVSLFSYLKSEFQYDDILEVYNCDFLSFELPLKPFKVFANIPFIITADVVRKLTGDKNFLEGYLVVQKEAAKKFIGMPYDDHNSMMAILLKPWFEVSVFWEFNRNDFIPVPNADPLMIHLKRIDHPIFMEEKRKLYESYIYDIFSRKKVSHLDFKRIVQMFKDFDREASRCDKNLITNRAQKIISAQKYLQKIHRSRTSANWKKQ